MRNKKNQVKQALRRKVKALTASSDWNTRSTAESLLLDWRIMGIDAICSFLKWGKM